MVSKVLSRVCDCGKGYRSWVDLRCGHCRGKAGTDKHAEFYRRAEAAVQAIQMEMFGFATLPVAPASSIVVKTKED